MKHITWNWSNNLEDWQTAQVKKEMFTSLQQETEKELAMNLLLWFTMFIIKGSIQMKEWQTASWVK